MLKYEVANNFQKEEYTLFYAIEPFKTVNYSIWIYLCILYITGISC